MTNPYASRVIWFDGRFVPFRKATVHLLTHSLHYGSAPFEGERFYATPDGPAIFRLPDHTKRFFGSLRTMRMRIPYTARDIQVATVQLIRRVGFKEGYIRPIAFYGSKMGLHPAGSSIHVALATWRWGAYLGGKPVKVTVSPILRLHPRSIFSHAKVSGYYANSIFATLDAKERGYDEALLLDTAGHVAEGPGENFFMVKKKKLYTPALGSILPGITRDSVMRIAQDTGIPVLEKRLRLHDLEGADEAFFTGTAAEVTPIARIDKIRFSYGPVTKRLRELYGRAVHGTLPRYERWLTHVNA